MKRLFLPVVAMAALLAFVNVQAGGSGVPQHSPVPNARPLVVVHKSPTCGCCMHWVAHLQEAGFTVDVRNEPDMRAVKTRLGVPDAMRSCHTAEVAGYFVEGHVPAADVERLLTERPEAHGLAVPGMPLGSPGMEHPAGHVQPYDVVLVTDGEPQVFSHHGK